MNAKTLRNISRNALHWRNLRVMAHKVWLRLGDRVSRRQRAQAKDWCAAHVEDVETFARSLDSRLWDEAVAFGAELQARGREKLGELGVDLGGGGHYPLLFFLARYLRPAAVLETGVAAGFSSAAILEALDRNGQGQLFSSDFPYFRLEEPEHFVGVMVEDRLKERWHLYLEGDRHNLPRILEVIGDDIPLVHYDSDKSPDGKRYFVDCLAGRSAAKSGKTFWIFDDIDDDSFFAGLVQARGLPHHVFAFEGKYLGLIEGLTKERN